MERQSRSSIDFHENRDAIPTRLFSIWRLHIQREVGMPQVVELASESEGFSLKHGGLKPAGGFADGRVTASRMADQSASADSPFATSFRDCPAFECFPANTYVEHGNKIDDEPFGS